MNPLILTKILQKGKQIFSNRNVQLGLIILLVALVFKGSIQTVIRKVRENHFDKNEPEMVNQLAQQYRAAVNPSGVSWMVGIDGTKDKAIELLAYRTKGKLNEVLKAYREKFDETLTDRLRQELSVKAYQNWLNIVT